MRFYVCTKVEYANEGASVYKLLLRPEERTKGRLALIVTREEFDRVRVGQAAATVNLVCLAEVAQALMEPPNIDEEFS